MCAASRGRPRSNPTLDWTTIASAFMYMEAEEPQRVDDARLLWLMRTVGTDKAAYNHLRRMVLNANSYASTIMNMYSNRRIELEDWSYKMMNHFLDDLIHTLIQLRRLSLYVGGEVKDAIMATPIYREEKHS